MAFTPAIYFYLLDGLRAGALQPLLGAGAVPALIKGIEIIFKAAPRVNNQVIITREI